MKKVQIQRLIDLTHIMYGERKMTAEESNEYSELEKMFAQWNPREKSEKFKQIFAKIQYHFEQLGPISLRNVYHGTEKLGYTYKQVSYVFNKMIHKMWVKNHVKRIGKSSWEILIPYKHEMGN